MEEHEMWRCVGTALKTQPLRYVYIYCSLSQKGAQCDPSCDADVHMLKVELVKVFLNALQTDRYACA